MVSDPQIAIGGEELVEIGEGLVGGGQRLLLVQPAFGVGFVFEEVGQLRIQLARIGRHQAMQSDLARFGIGARRFGTCERGGDFAPAADKGLKMKLAQTLGHDPVQEPAPFGAGIKRPAEADRDRNHPQKGRRECPASGHPARPRP
jgi:hypothetical protein